MPTLQLYLKHLERKKKAMFTHQCGGISQLTTVPSKGAAATDAGVRRSCQLQVTSEDISMTKTMDTAVEMSK